MLRNVESSLNTSTVRLGTFKEQVFLDLFASELRLLQILGKKIF